MRASKKKRGGEFTRATVGLWLGESTRRALFLRVERFGERFCEAGAQDKCKRLHGFLPCKFPSFFAHLHTSD
jgi:hypothetical protein